MLTCPQKSTLALALVLAAPFHVSAVGDVIHFVNGDPATHHWKWLFSENWQSWLDITRAPDDQPDVEGGNAVAQINISTQEFWNMTNFGARVASSQSGPYELTKALAHGESVAANQFAVRAIHIFSEFTNGPFLTDFPMGEIRYIGVLTESGNYGWIAVRRGTSYPGHFSLEALEWAYETIPGKGINAGEVPVPAGLALFTSLFFVRSSRRRSHASG